jgi:hypothetical protein
MELGFHRFPSGKQYAFMLQDGHHVFIRNIIFLTKGEKIVMVREWGAKSDKHVWEPPKGQMEWSEFASAGIRAGSKHPMTKIMKCMKKAMLREMVEEAKVMTNEIQHMRALPLRYQQAWLTCDLPNSHFMYQFWTAELTTLKPAQERMKTLVENPDWKGILPKDLTEKDRVEWWKPTDGWEKVRAGFSKKMMRMYFDFLNVQCSTDGV